MTRVVMLTNAVAPDKAGGLERYVRELSRVLVMRGHDVTVVAKRLHPDHPPVEVAEDGVHVVRYPVPSKRNPAFAPLYPAHVATHVRRVLRELSPTVVHAHFPVPAVPLVLPRRWLPFVYTFHAPVYRELLSERNGTYALPPWSRALAVRGLRAAEARVVGAASAVTLLSQFMRGELAELHAPTARRAVLIPGGLDVEAFAPGPPQPPVDTGPATGPVLFTARRLTPRTGVVPLLEAMAIVRRTRPDVRLVVAGDGPQRDEVRRTSHRHGLDDSVVLLGRISDAELRSWYRRADLVVMPTTELEGFGLTTAEAMASGTPVAVTPVGANPELVTPIHPRLVLPGTSPSDMAAGLTGLLSDLAEVTAFSAACRRHAVDTWSWAMVCARLERVYAEVQRDRVAGSAARRGAARG